MSNQETADTLGDHLDYLLETERDLRLMEERRLQFGLGPSHLAKKADDIASYMRALANAFKLPTNPEQ